MTFLSAFMVTVVISYNSVFQTVVRGPLGVRGALPGGPRASQEILKCPIRKRN